MSSGEMDAQQRPEQLCLTGKCPLPSQIQTVGAKPSRMLSNAVVTAHIGGALTGRTLLPGSRGEFWSPLPSEAFLVLAAQIQGCCQDKLGTLQQLKSTDYFTRLESQCLPCCRTRVGAAHTALAVESPSQGAEEAPDTFPVTCQDMGCKNAWMGFGLLGSAVLCFCGESCRQIRLLWPCGLQSLS